jgi:hypothetical protein
MIPAIRHQYNAAFRPASYDAFLRDLNTAMRYPADFKVSETPLFMPADLTARLLAAAEQIITAIQTPTYRAHTQDAIPPGYAVPGEDPHPLFLQCDFALCQDADGTWVPRLIELQGFPSLYCFQAFLDQKYRQHLPIPEGVTAYFSGLDYAGYVEAMRQAVVADADPEQTVLVEVRPEAQSTRIDFACTEHMLGVPTVDATQIIVRGSRAYYRREGREVPIQRIYNRVIRDDPQIGSAEEVAWMSRDLEVEWAGHPNWYYRISKVALPILHRLIDAPVVPECHFVSDLSAYPADLGAFVLKPLFLYSGAGIQLDVTPAMLDALPDKRAFILQRKVSYGPAVQTPDMPAMAEVRMLHVWQDRPIPVGNLVRMSKGKMMGVRYNRDKTWVGSTVAYHRP